MVTETTSNYLKLLATLADFDRGNYLKLLATLADFDRGNYFPRLKSASVANVRKRPGFSLKISISFAIELKINEQLLEMKKIHENL